MYIFVFRSYLNLPLRCLVPCCFYSTFWHFPSWTQSKYNGFFLFGWSLFIFKMTHNRVAQGAHPWEIHPLNRIKVSIWRFFQQPFSFRLLAMAPKISWPWKRNLNLTKFDVAETSPHAFHQPTPDGFIFLNFHLENWRNDPLWLERIFQKIGSTTTSNPPFSREKRHVAGDTATAILLPKVVDAVRGKMSPLTGKPVQVVSQMNDTIQ